MKWLKKILGQGHTDHKGNGAEDGLKKFTILKFDGVAALKQAQFEYAIKCFTMALTIREDGEIRDYLSQAYIQVNDFESAYEQLTRLLDSDPMNIHILLRMAEVAYLMEDYITMTDVCEKANTIDSENPVVNYYFAKACIGHENFINAIALLTKAIAVSGEDTMWEAYLLRGQTMYMTGDLCGGLEDAEYILREIPDHEDAILLKANCLTAEGKHQDAIVLYDQAIAINPFSLQAFKDRSKSRTAVGDIRGGEEDRLMALQLCERQQAQVS